MNYVCPLSVAGLALALVHAAHAAEPVDASRQWPQFRGPSATGVAPHADPPTEWADGKNIRWKTPIPGRGNASPIVWNDRIYLLTAVKVEQAGAAADPLEDSSSGTTIVRGPQAQDGPPASQPGAERARRPRAGGPRAEKPTSPYRYTVLALDRENGRIIWETAVREKTPHAGTHPDSTFASASCVTDGEYLYAFFGSEGLYCLDLDGNVKWDVDFGDMKTRNSFGEGASPAVFGDTVVITWDHEEDDFIVALDRRSGKEIWRQKRDEPTSWSTPLIVSAGGKPQVITPGAKRCRSYDLATGEVIWECGGLTENVIPTPVYADGLVYFISGFRGAALKAIRLADARGNLDENKSAVVWTYDKNTPYVPSPLLYDDKLYFLDNNRALVTCLNARTGEKLWGPERLEGMQNIYASIVGAAGRVYIAARDGKVAVLKHGASFEILAMNSLDDSFDATPAIAGKELYLRGGGHLYCIAAP
ncbi:outer membrane biogenesis protein BamB [Phycisphaerae bacterium RAS1]|nr:outer membrane biogenesis protein BamB [Phycisphaerae bacterium RAS1]